MYAGERSVYKDIHDRQALKESHAASASSQNRKHNAVHREVKDTTSKTDRVPYGKKYIAH